LWPEETTLYTRRFSITKIETWQRALVANRIVDSLTLPDAVETTTVGCWRTLPRIHRKQLELPLAEPVDRFGNASIGANRKKRSLARGSSILRLLTS